jgi:hypothetical protein
MTLLPLLGLGSHERSSRTIPILIRKVPWWDAVCDCCSIPEENQKIPAVISTTRMDAHTLPLNFTELMTWYQAIPLMAFLQKKTYDNACHRNDSITLSTSLLSFIFFLIFLKFLLLFICAYTRLGSFHPPCPHSLPYHPSAPSLSPPPPQYPAETILPLSLILL